MQQIPEDDVPRTGRVFAALRQKLGYSCDRAPYAVRGCQDSGFCVTGCIYGAKQVPSSLAVNTSLTILANAERIAAGMLDRHGLRPT